MTADPSHVAAYNEVMATPMTIPYALALELIHRVVPDDRADRGPVRRALLEEIGEIVQHRHQGVPLGDRPEVRQVPLQRIDRRVIVRGKLLRASLVLPVAPLVADHL